MVHGLDIFKEYFIEHTNKYVFIGGTACDILMEDMGVSFRTTKDLDIVLIVEALDISFGEAFWKFIDDGGYKQRQKNTGEEQFYRFSDPSQKKFPKMIEIFSRKPHNSNLEFDKGLTPIHIDDSIISLSAIILDDDYYDLLLNSIIKVDEFSIIKIETIILFKIKAWLDNKARKENGEKINSLDIKKHKNDIFRLLANVLPSNQILISKEIESDVRLFMKKIYEDMPSLKDLGIKESFEEMMDLLESVFLKLFREENKI